MLQSDNGLEKSDLQPVFACMAVIYPHGLVIAIRALDKQLAFMTSCSAPWSCYHVCDHFGQFPANHPLEKPDLLMTVMIHLRTAIQIV